MSIDPTGQTASQTITEIRKVVLRISVVSHAPTQSYDVVMKADDTPATPPRWRLNDRREPVPHLGAHHTKGGDTLVPRGKISPYDDMQEGYRQKSHVYFQRKLNRILNYGKSTESDLITLLEEAKQTLEDWIKTPQYDGEEQLEPGTFNWKCAIADDHRPLEKIKDHYRVSQATVYRYRVTYRGLRKSSVRVTS